MGYLIKKAKSDLIKVETIIKAADMQQLATAPYTLTTTQKAGFTFVPVTIFIQVNGTTSYNAFTHCWIWQGGGTGKTASFGKTLNNFFGVGTTSSFIVNVDHGTTATNQFGIRTVSNRDFILEMNIDDASGDGNGLLTMYGYYVPDFI